MSPQKEIVQCFPVLSIKQQVDQKATSVKFDSADISGKTWNRYPCDRDQPQKCVNDHCQGRVSFFIERNSRKELKILTLLFVHDNKSAYVFNNQQLRNLFSEGILSQINPENIQLKPPVISGPTNRVAY